MKNALEMRGKLPNFRDLYGIWYFEAKSYIKNVHVSNNCANHNFTINSIRHEAYGFKLSVHIKKIISQCHICMRFRAHPYRYPQQPVLPLQRVMVDRLFAAMGVDYAGPFNVRHGEKDKKVFNDNFQQGNIGFRCNGCKAVFRSNKGLSLHWPPVYSTPLLMDFLVEYIL